MAEETARLQTLTRISSKAQKSASSHGIETVAQPFVFPIGQKLPGILQRAKRNVGLFTPAEILCLQSTIGNQAVGRLIATGGEHQRNNEVRRRQDDVNATVQHQVSESGASKDSVQENHLAMRAGIPGTLDPVIRGAAKPVRVLQAKLTIGAPDDIYEKEAEAVAERVMSNSSTLLQQHAAGSPASEENAFPAPVIPELRRQCACGGGPEEECADCRMKRLAVQSLSSGGNVSLEAPAIVEDVRASPGQPLAESASKATESASAVNALAYTVGRDIVYGTGQPGTEASPIIHEVLPSPGQPLDQATRGFMEPRFQADFSNVRVDSTAVDSAKAVNALAYTVADHIIFASGRYSPKEGAARRLLAHELAHGRQQAGTTAINPDRLQRAPDKEKPKAEESDCTPSPETYDKVRSFDKDNIALGLTQPRIEFSWKPQFTKGQCSVKLSKAKLSFKPFVFTKEGTYVFGPAVDKSGTCKGKLDHILRITGPMAERIEQGEREHCEDVRLAFSLSYEKYTKACEDLGAGFPAANAKECSAQVSARLKDAVGIDPSQWTKVADCLVKKTMERDSKEKGWHLARLEGSFDKDCKHFTSTPDPNKSLPEVGKHPSSELVKGCGE